MEHEEIEREERDARPEEADRGKVLDALADGAYWAFLLLEIGEDGGLELKVEQDDRLDLDTLKALIEKVWRAL